MEAILQALQRAGAPPIFTTRVMNKLADRPAMPPVLFPDPLFTCARKDQNGRRMPQTIAHRGYKAKYAENTMTAFKAAVQVGVHALETDVHITKDDVVVLSHDPSLTRCYGVNKKILDCDWDFISGLKGLSEPHDTMPRLQDLIEYLSQPGLENIWLLLDIKMDNDPDKIMRLMSQAINSVPPQKGTQWKNRIILGCWAARFIPPCDQYLSGYAVTNIGFSLPYSRQFLAVPNMSFNMLQASLVSPSGRSFIQGAKNEQRRVYSWTVNDEKLMDWCIRKGLDGVITDDPKKFLDFCDTFDENRTFDWPWLVVVNFVRINVFAFIFGILFWWRHGFGLDKKYLVDRSR